MTPTYFALNTRAARQYMLGLLLATLAMLAIFKPVNNGGDFIEYTLVTSAIASHGSPEVRLSDIADLKRMLPEQAWVYELLEKDMLANKQEVYAAFVRGREDKVYAVHFFGYPALAAVPFKLLQWTGLPPFKCFQVLNLALVFMVGLGLFRLYGTAGKAGAALLLFMGCGGVLYWPWSSPECMSAAALLAGLLFYATGAPLRGGLLGGLAALQNPTILFFFAFAPLLKLIIEYQPRQGFAANLRRQISARAIAGLGLGLTLLALPPLFNLYQWGVPNIIVKKFSDVGLISMTRLLSFFFDLNQGMLIAIPGVALALLALLLPRTPERRRGVLALGAAGLLLLALTVPALAVLNWNSGAIGIMRYVSWASMPLLFVLFWRLSLQKRWPPTLLAVTALLQLACMAHALSYPYVQFSPLAKLMLRYAPAHYHPEPEIFAERSGENDDYLNPALVYTYPRQGQPVKWLYNRAQQGIEVKLCGPGKMLAPDNRMTNSVRNWRYIDGELRCINDDGSRIQLQVEDMRQADMIKLVDGWSSPDAGGGIWNGAWSVSAESQILLTPPAGRRVRTLTLLGHYGTGNQRTRVSVNGVDLGWAALDQAQAIVLPDNARAADGSLRVLLRHEAPQAPGGGDPRLLAYFVQGVVLE